MHNIGIQAYCNTIQPRTCMLLYRSLTTHHTHGTRWQTRSEHCGNIVPNM